MNKKPPAARSAALVREARRLQKETRLTILFAATQVWLAQLNLRRARRLLGALKA